MLKKSMIIIMALAMTAGISACGTKDNASQIDGNGAASATTAAPASDTAAAATLAPAATPAPDSAEKAESKVEANNGASNMTVIEDGETREVNMAFTLENHTGLDFPAMLLAPVTVDITQTTNIFPEDFVFADGASINLDPGASDPDTALDTTLFNLAAVDSTGKGYVFQNIDLSANSVIQLYIDNGVPKAVIN